MTGPSPDSDSRSQPQRLGSYQLLEEIGRGGMGVVYRAHDPGLQRDVAIKLILSENPRAGRRFLTEARAVARLRHPGVIAVHAVAEEGDRPYLVMDLVQGESLQARLDRQGALEPRQAARITLGLARALEHAHAAGILHRDVKPDNVLLTQDSAPILTDFGLARDLEEGAADRLTQAGNPLGTPGFVPPEQARGELDLIGPASDVYGLGATLYAMLCERPPHGLAQGREPVTPPSQLGIRLDPELEVICLRCLQHEPAARFASAAALAQRLESYLAAPSPAASYSVALPGEGVAAAWPAKGIALAVLLGAVALAGWILTSDVAETAPLSRATPAPSPSAPAPVTPLQGVEPALGDLSVEAGRHYERGLALNAAGDLQAAIAAFTLALEVEPEQPQPYFERALARDRSGDLAGALDDYSRSLELRPHAMAYNNRGWVHVRRREFDLALADLERAIALDPRLALAFLNRAEVREALGDLEGAKADLARAAELAPRDARALTNLGNILSVEGRDASALELYDRAVERDPSHSLSYYNRGNLRFDQGDLPGAIADYSTCLELRPTLVPAIHNRGNAFATQGKLEQALADYGRGLAIDASDPELHHSQGEAFRRLKRWDEAAAAYTRALELDPRRTRSYRARAGIRLVQGRLDTALADLEQGIQLDPQAPELWILLGSLRSRRKELRQSDVAFTRALELLPAGSDRARQVREYRAKVRRQAAEEGAPR